jgi:dipeptidase
MNIAKTKRIKACTTGCGGKNSTVYGATWTSHSDDGSLSDSSISYVPAKDHQAGEMRNVYITAVADDSRPVWNSYLTPRLNCAERGPDYDYGNKYPKSIVAGKIPEVSHTYAYLDGNYGIINEKGLSFGECTDGSFFTCGPTDGNDGTGDIVRLFYSSELTRVALERCDNCRDAIKLIIDFVEKYGYWGTAETIPAADGEEAWVIDMAPSKTGKGGYVAATRIPDDEVFWAGNEIRTRQINQGGDKDHINGNQIFKDFSSSSVDYLKCVSAGEYNHPYYSLRRVWRGFTLFAPSRAKKYLSDDVTPNPNYLDPKCSDGLTKQYPFSIKPDKKLTLEDIEAAYRDHYEGTEFSSADDTTSPFGNPYRFNTHGYDASGDVGTGAVNGAWERTISWFDTNYSFINITDKSNRKELQAISYVALNIAGESTFVPIPVSKVLSSYTKISAYEFDIEKAWWVYNRVGDAVTNRYCYAIKDLIPLREQLETEGKTLINQLNASDLTSDEIYNSLRFHAAKCTDEMRKLWHKLIVKYNQGLLLNEWPATAFAIGYPAKWLEKNEKWLNGPKQY